MTGEYQHSIDAKGRIFIPARLRDELGNIFYITISMEQCLNVYSEDSWQEFCNKVNAMSYVNQRRMRPFFAYASKCEPDTQGRILIPQNLREFAGVSKNVTVVGCNNHAEIWDADRWKQLCPAEIAPEHISDVLKELNF